MPPGSSPLRPPFASTLPGANAYGMSPQQYQLMQQNAGSQRQQKQQQQQQQVNGGQQYQPQKLSGMSSGGSQLPQANAASQQPHQGPRAPHYPQPLQQGGPFAHVDTAKLPQLPAAQGGYPRHPPPSGGGHRGLLG
uniref:Uncharacterized protein n=1 Tax=Plectus sambesii TaxID=2011161 RepID=A0A914UUD9_9BILA